MSRSAVVKAVAHAVPLLGVSHFASDQAPLLQVAGALICLPPEQVKVMVPPCSVPAVSAGSVETRSAVVKAVAHAVGPWTLPREQPPREYKGTPYAVVNVHASDLLVMVC